jgi:4-diphosphocytidyl-2-C-methyl-D-erythritol kinase
MLIERLGDAVVAWAPAKVNLHLEILAKRPDGYHEINSLLVSVSLYDTLEFRDDSSGHIHLECDQAGLPTGKENLVYRAASLLRPKSGGRGVAIRLGKRIPVAAGLAGGSSDAAATLAALNELWRLGLATDQLKSLSAGLGSDVPFFFATPAAWCTGRGEIASGLALKPLWFVLLCPPFGLATADVYRTVKVPADPENGIAIKEAVQEGDVEKIGRRMFNRLQPAAEALCPALAQYEAELKRAAPLGQLMSGSGTSFFALCRDQAEAQRVALKLRTGSKEAMDSRVFIVRSCS